MILVAYYEFTIPDFNFEFRDGLVKSGKHRTSHMQMSWTMKRAKDAPTPFIGYFMRSMDYRSNLRLKYLAIPENGVTFFTLFLDDVHQRWQELFTTANEYISTTVSPALQSIHLSRISYLKLHC